MPITIGIINCGVYLIIENTQSLSADQVRKYNITNAAYCPVKVIQLDSIKTEELANELKDYLTSLSADTNVSVFLYSSPESVLKSTFLLCFINLSTSICLDLSALIKYINLLVLDHLFA